ncbi:MAG: DUF4232 domain-containing protein [Acidobacteria bacterium]|nr:DUF4232 domain-containing protein [Acidobacteriota bacterium]
MTFTPVQDSPLVETPEPIEVLIEEARQKTRRRRARFAFVALMALGIVVGLITWNNVGRTAPRASGVTTLSAVSTGAVRCNVAHLRVTSLGAPGGSMHDGVIVRVHNVGANACTLSGYATVQGINRWNERVLTGTPTRTSYLGGWNSSKPLPTVTLRAKIGIASFLVTGVDAAITNPSCPNFKVLRVTIPPSTAVFALPTYFNACRGGFQVHPFVPGVTGNVEPT